MGSGCCGRLYEGNINVDQNGLICKRRNPLMKQCISSSQASKIFKNYTHLPNKFETHKESLESLGRAGLQNMGNTCFMSAALQCLSNIQPLTDYFLSSVHEDEINSRFNGEVALAYGDLIRAQWKNDYEQIQPIYFCNLIWEIAPQFSPGEQNDSQEFLSYILQSLHEELNRSIEKATDAIEKSEENEENQAAFVWKESLISNASVIVDLFQGQLKSMLHCLHCGFKSVTFDEFMSLTVPIPNIDSCTLKDCLKEFTKEELLIKNNRWKCHSCGHRSRAKKKIDMWKLPPVLIIHLKRFQFSKKNNLKIQKFVDFPVDELDFLEFDLGPQKVPSKYKLFAKIDHIGVSNTGHYVAQALNCYDQKWYDFDDEIVNPVEKDSLVSQYAYVLFYYNDSLASYPTQSALLPQFWPHVIEPQSKRASELNLQALNTTNLSFNSGN